MEKRTHLVYLLALCLLALNNLPFSSVEKEVSLNSETPKKAQKRRTPKRSVKLGKPKTFSYKKENKILLNDPLFQQQWGLKTQNPKKAWEQSKGSQDIIVAVIDTGADVYHPDLKKNIWKNKGEMGLDAYGRNKATNGVDDDKNGYIDDVYGWNFVGNNNNVQDNHGHGTHVAGIIGAEGGNRVGIAGVAPNVSIMVLKYYDSNNLNNNLDNIVPAINYARKMGAHIINYSGGGLQPNENEKEAIRKAGKKGILFVAAAGNEYSNSDVKPYYPADYNLDNIISVGAVQPQKKMVKSSNYGVKTVDIAAPGYNIYSTLPNNKYGYLTGTSQATPFVSGVASLLMAKNPHLRNAKKIKKYLVQTGTEEASLINKTSHNTMLNSYRALMLADSEQSVSGTITNQNQLPSERYLGNSANRQISSQKNFLKTLKSVVRKKQNSF